ncbi:hypothetical protein INT47_008244 [Mucor saturninus]|uniref:Tc1-like transposase DDE domain-containing protein n=1 Tax=Mucor saturninus TaxID=64648 RepID=A0A8H7QGF1_9FUNG|nr:hypothetical protein INT47_008244 [Mucor saturninus]
MQVEDYNKANEIVMREPYFEDVIDEINVDEDPATTFGKLILLADDSTVPQQISIDNEIEEESVSEAIENDVNSNISLRTPQTTDYKAYGPDNIRMFLPLMQKEGPSWNESDGTVIPIGCLRKSSKIGGAKRANSCKITAQQTDFLAELVDKNPCITTDMAREKLYSSFEGFSICQSWLRKHMVEKIRLSLKDSHVYTMERDAKRTLDLRFNVITAWKAAGIRSKAVPVKGTPAIVSVPTQKGINLIIIGYISPFGTINLSKVEPLQPADVAKIEKEFPLPRHQKKKGIHYSYYVADAIESKGYKPLFMSPYSPFLNPIEECYSKIKKHIKRNTLSTLDTLTPRVKAACETIITEDCNGWIRHSETYWDKCLKKESKLV